MTALRDITTVVAHITTATALRDITTMVAHIQGSRFLCRRKSSPTGGHFRRQTKRDPCNYGGSTEGYNNGGSTYNYDDSTEVYNNGGSTYNYGDSTEGYNNGGSSGTGYYA